MAFSILEKVTRTERTLANGCGNHVDRITMAAADHITHGRVTAASALVGERAMVAVAEGASMRADGVSCSRPFERNGGGKAKTEGSSNLGGAEALGAALSQKGSTGVMENANMGGERQGGRWVGTLFKRFNSEKAEVTIKVSLARTCALVGSRILQAYMRNYRACGVILM